MELRANARSSRGFTLIELMIVVVIGTILISIAIPSYMTYIRQSRRMDAKTASLDIASREERFFTINGSSYTTATASLGYGTVGWPVTVGSGYYQVSVCSLTTGAAGTCAPSPNTAANGPIYTVTATALNTQSQWGDTQCRSFSVDSSGAQYALDSGGNPNGPFCWAN